MKKEDFIAGLRSGSQNPAVARHIAKVEAMDETQFAAHLVHLDEMAARFAPAIKRMVKEVVRKTSRSR